VADGLNLRLPAVIFYKESIIQGAETVLIKQHKRKLEAVFKKADTGYKRRIFSVESGQLKKV
jgi:hypothetical protein